jgi:hypothetical protein
VSALEEITAFLEGEGVENVVWSLHEGRPECVFVAEYPGGPPGQVKNSAEILYELVRPQVIVRGEDPQEARMRAERIYRLLGAVRDRELGGVHYDYIKALGSPFRIAQDERGRFLYSVNFMARKALSPE